MHALMVTFNPTVSEAEFGKEMGPKMEAVMKAEGLIMKTFVAADEKTWGGFYIFNSPEAANQYLAGDFFKSFSTSPLLSNCKVQHLGVDVELSKAFGTPTTPLATRL